MTEYPSIKAVETPVNDHTSPQVERSTEKPSTIGSTEKTLEESPYIKELFKMGEAAGQFEMPTLVKEIDSYVLNEIKENNLENTRESYEEIIAGFVKRLNMPANLDIYARTERLASLLRIQSKLNQAAREREELLKKPISEMTSRQLKEYINAIDNKRIRTRTN